MTLLLREADVRALVAMPDALEALEFAFREWAAGRAENQPRRRVAGGVVLAVMSAALPARHVVGFKGYTASKDGARFLVHLFDARDGRLQAIIEADWLGALRTGAASGLATRYLARPDAAVLAVLGAGRQALTQVLAVTAVRRLTEIRVVSRNAEHRARFVRELDGQVGEARVREVLVMKDALDGADLVTTITSAGTPLFPGNWLEPGQHLNVAGSNYRNRREVDARAVGRADLIVTDDVDAARLEAGDLLLAEEEGQLGWGRVHSLAEVVAGTVARSQPSDITLFKSVGLALEDVALAATVVERARAAGVGETLDL